MENCVIQEITYIDEFLSLCEIASKSKHPNAKNYDVEQVNASQDVTEQNMNGTDITKLDSIISAKDGGKTVETELQMKKELESFIQGLQ